LQVLTGVYQSDPPQTLRTRLRTLLRLVYNLVTLPIARLELNHLAKAPQNRSLAVPHMAPEAASNPTPQDER
jgi:hypothetical protein